MIAPAVSLENQRQIKATKVRRLKIELGFDGAALLPSHLDTFDKLADLLVDGHCRPLSQVKESNLGRVRELVAELPSTREVRRFLTATVNGPERHVI